MCQSPFLDVHGEEDAEMRRGKPLFLNAHGYAVLSAIWAGAGLDFESSTLHAAQRLLQG